MLVRYAALGVSAFAANHGRAQITVSNLSANYSTNWIVAPSNFVAGSFTTDGYQSSFQLASVTVRLGSGVGTPGGFAVRLFSDSSGQPGTAFETLSGASNPSGNSTQAYTSAGTTLSANITYWIVASASTGNVNTDYYHVAMTNSLSETTVGSASWLIGNGTRYSLDDGSSWFTYTDNIPMFSVTTVAAVPEPSTYATIFGACALGLVAYRRHRLRKADIHKQLLNWRPALTDWPFSC